MDVVVLQKTAESIPEFPYPVVGNFKLHNFKQYYDFQMYEPSADLEPFVAYYSIFEPKIPPGHELQFTQVLKVPTASLMFSHKKSLLFGITTKRIEHRSMAGDTKIRVIFKPAGLRAFCPKTDMAALVDTRTPIKNYFPHFNEQFTEDLLNYWRGNEIVNKLDNFLMLYRPVLNENIILINGIIKNLDVDESPATVKQLASKYNKSERSVQALFRSYVGVGLKWIIMRARLIKILRSVDSEEEIPWAHLAADLGYSTQSHLINDFKNIIGLSPTDFMAIKLGRITQKSVKAFP